MAIEQRVALRPGRASSAVFLFVGLVVANQTGAALRWLEYERNLLNYIREAVYCTSLAFFLCYCAVGFKSGQRIGLALWFLIIWGCAAVVNAAVGMAAAFGFSRPLFWFDWIVAAWYLWIAWCLDSLRSQAARLN